MKSATLQRLESDDLGTFGTLVITGTDNTWMTAELPWRDNQRGKSCIPAGTYELRWQQSPRMTEKYGTATFKYEFIDVPGRDQVLVHSGNFCGDADMGWDAQVKGCVLLGKRIDKLTNSKGVAQKAILLSSGAVAEFEQYMAQQPLKLTVLDVPKADYSMVGS